MTGEKIENKKKSTNEYISFFELVFDIIGNISYITLFVVSIITVTLTVLWNNIDYCEDQKSKLCGDILVMCSCVLGFVITAFSVILSLGTNTLGKLSKMPKKPNRWWAKYLRKKSNPYDILCASFSLTCIILLLTIIIVMLYKDMPDPSYMRNWLFVLIKVLSIISVLLVFDLIFHLYSVSTYLNENHHRAKLFNNKDNNKD